MARRSGKGTGRHKASGSAPKRSTGRMRSASARASGARPAARARAGHQLYPVICSECYEEFMFDSGVDADALVCPVCEHSASRPNDATLKDLDDKLRGEKSSFMLSFLVTLVGIGAYGAWTYLMLNPANAQHDAKFWGPIGVAGLAVVLLVVFTVKHEGSRYEAYF